MMRMVLLADVHLGTTQTQMPGQDYVYAADVLRRAVPLVNAALADEVVIVGDLVNMGTADEYELARNILSELNAPITTIAGNHELIRGTLADFRAAAPGAAVATGRFDADSSSVVFLNSGIEGMTPWHWHGRADAANLALLDRAANEFPDRPLIVFCHHPPEGTVLVPGYPMMGLTNSDEVMNRLLRHPSPVVMFCGHTHVPDVYRRRNLTIIACPALCFWPHAFLVVELDRGLLHIKTHRVIESAVASPDPHIKNTGYLHEREPWVPELSVRLSMT